MLEKEEKEKLKKIIAIDGKTMRGNTKNDEKPNHIVISWNREDGYSIGQQRVNEKSNEITAISKLLDKINIKNSIVTIDAMGTQTAITEKIKSEREHLKEVLQKSLTVFPESAAFVKPAKRTLNNPSFRKNDKCVKFISFYNLNLCT